ncbi:carbohydrate esterase family 9 [Lecanosticta acicola]|uniref:Carbohydrate esterase family 9 n=1 Tax=Lecanosticta acicola TaxID=111012 RepID=A0AAI9EB22_9PEZI|nr:carbohydrate esterase family 9 [Lecanosticta acicola]
MDKDTADGLPPYTRFEHHGRRYRRRRECRRIFRWIALAGIMFMFYCYWRAWNEPQTRGTGSKLLSLDRLQQDYATCGKLRHKPQDPSGYRERNARYVEGQKPILIRNATVWTGEPSADVTIEEAREGKGYSWIQADVLLQYGLITRVEAGISTKELPDDYEIFDAQGRQLTAGIVDMHSHAGVDSLPDLRGSSDTNELSSDITPYVRSIDGLNPLDRQIQVIKSGGVTTSLILPGSGNNIGGEAFVIKHAVGKADGRPELSIEDMLADPDNTWRYMKMACGENAKSVYGKVGRDFGPFSRLGEAWYFRHAFEEAAKIKNAQDDWCAAADRVGVQNMDSYLPQDLKWESLAAVLRGQVHVNTHCYTVPDLESFIGYTNEFKFPVRAFHHAHSTYLVPEVLKRAYGGRAPAAALFADNMNYKAEGYVASEKAGKILYENGITPVYVSDNPVINAQHVVFEAAKAFKNGLKYHAALAGVTTASAELLGLGERIGKVKAGFDADVVVWDSDPLSVGSTPLQVFIDGVPQFQIPTNFSKPLTPPLETIDRDDLGEDPVEIEDVVLTGVTRILLPGHEQTWSSPTNVAIKGSRIVCVGECASHLQTSLKTLDLQDGHIAPGLTAFGSLLGLEEIAAEEDTSDGANDQSSFSAAIDGLSFEGKNLRAALSHGVTRAITAPKFGGSADHKGLSVGFRLGARHSLAGHAVFNAGVGAHYTLAKQERTPSVSSAIEELRVKLMKGVASSNSSKTEEEKTLEEKVVERVVGEEGLPLIIGVHSADIIASLLRLKGQVEEAMNKKRSGNDSPGTAAHLRVVILGGAEAHLVAKELAEAGVGVVLAPLFSYATSWDQRRALTGAPLTNATTIDVLHAAGVTVAIGVDEDWEARDLFLQAGIVQANSRGKINETEALALVSSNIYELMGMEADDAGDWEFVVSEGHPFQIESRVRAVADGTGKVSVWW